MENINKEENLNYNYDELNEIQKYFDSDIRSMINFLQNNSNQVFKLNLINYEKLNELFKINTLCPESKSFVIIVKIQKKNFW